MPTNKPEVVLPELPELISSLQSMRDRMMAALPAKFGDGFDGDFDVLLEAINTLKRLAAYGQACIDTLTRPADGEFVMVPREATGDMLDAMIAPLLRGAGTERECLTAGWKGALSAAPQQPAEAVAWIAEKTDRSSFPGKVITWRNAFLTYPADVEADGYRITPLYLTPPPAIDIGKLRENTHRLVAAAAAVMPAPWKFGAHVPFLSEKWTELGDAINALIGDGGEKK